MKGYFDWPMGEFWNNFGDASSYLGEISVIKMI